MFTLPLLGSVVFQQLYNISDSIIAGRFAGEDVYTTAESDKLLRLPLYYGLTAEDRQAVIQAVKAFYGC